MAMQISVPVAAITRVEYYRSGTSSWNVLFAAGSVPGHPNLLLVSNVPESLARLAAISATATRGSFEIGVTGTFTTDGTVDYTDYKGDGPCRYSG
jgi:hypothetical protein